MKETLYPTIEEALYLHRVLLERFGEAQGVLDKGLLESALARPRTGYYHTLSEQAAALMQSVAMNDSFVDGNKRLAFGLTAVFLRLNGVRLKVEAKAGVRFIEVDLIAQRAPLETIRRLVESQMV